MNDPEMTSPRATNRKVEDVPQDVTVDRETKRAHRRRALDRLTAEASEAGLYDRGAADYRDALEQARREVQRENQKL